MIVNATRISIACSFFQEVSQYKISTSHVFTKNPCKYIKMFGTTTLTVLTYSKPEIYVIVNIGMVIREFIAPQVRSFKTKESTNKGKTTQKLYLLQISFKVGHN